VANFQPDILSSVAISDLKILAQPDPTDIVDSIYSACLLPLAYFGLRNHWGFLILVPLPAVYFWCLAKSNQKRRAARIELLRRDHLDRIEDASDMLKWHQFWKRTPEIYQLLIQAMQESEKLQLPLSTKLQIGANRFLKSLKPNDPLFEPTTQFLKGRLTSYDAL
jgi:hypothetical protein